MKKHIAIMREPYLGYVLDGSKTIESRFSKNKCPPWKKVDTGDIIYFKKSGGKIVARASVMKVIYIKLTKEKLERILHEIGDKLKINDEFINEKKDSAYCTLIWLSGVTKIEPISFEKKDRRAWIVLNKNDPER